MEKASTLSGEGKQSNITPKPSMLLMMTDSFSNIVSYLPKVYGPVGASMIYSMGYENGSHEVKRLRSELKTLELPLPKQQLLEKALNRVSSMGWGKISIEHNNEVMGKVNIFVNSNPFKRSCKNHGTPGCSFLRGYIAGIVAETYEEDIKYDTPECLEVKYDCCLLRLNNVDNIKKESQEELSILSQIKQ